MYALTPTVNNLPSTTTVVGLLPLLVATTNDLPDALGVAGLTIGIVITKFFPLISTVIDLQFKIYKNWF